MGEAKTELFCKDAFSRPGPHFTETSPENKEKVRNAIRAHFPEVFGSLDFDVFAVEGNELNSKNFLVKTRTEEQPKQAFLKVLCAEEAGKLESIAKMHALLHERGLPVAPVMPNLHGRLVAHERDACWMMTQRMIGHYFSGNSTSALLHAGQLYAQMKNVLSGIGDDVVGKERIEFLHGDEEQILGEVKSCGLGLMSMVGGEGATALHANRDILLQKTVESGFLGFYYVPGDCKRVYHDYHPHNLLENEGEISAILDIGSVVFGSAAVSTSFCAFKLLRQHVCAQKSVQCAAPTIREYCEITGPDYTWQEFARYSTIEVLRRVFIILRQALRGDTRWCHNLPVQLRALHETEELFKVR